MKKYYKGFKKGLVCRGKQYQENTIFEEEKAEVCRSGNAVNFQSPSFFWRFQSISFFRGL